jgi:hypothetical protein
LSLLLALLLLHITRSPSIFANGESPQQKSYTPKQWEAKQKADAEAAAVAEAAKVADVADVKEEFKATIAESDPPATTS